MTKRGKIYKIYLSKQIERYGVANLCMDNNIKPEEQTRELRKQNYEGIAIFDRIVGENQT